MGALLSAAEQVEERLAAMFFLMCRDVMPAGNVVALIELVSKGEKFDYGGSALEPFARSLAKGLLGAPGSMDTKARREFLESLPQRIQASRHLTAVLNDMGEFPFDDKSRARIIDTVVSLQREARTAERRGHVTGDRPEDRHQGLSDPMG